MIEKAIKSVDDKFIQKAFKSVQSWIGDNKNKEYFVNMMINSTKNFIQDKYADLLNDNVITRICNKVHDEAAEQILNATKPNLVFGIDMSHVQDIIQTCGQVDLTDENNTEELMCVKKVLNAAGGIDPTGLTTMAAAFMNPVCNL